MALKGDSDCAVNMWRRWYFDHCLNRSQGSPLGAKSCYVHTGGDEFTLADEENQLGAISTYLERGEKPDIWWIDAGWYPCTNPDGLKGWTRTGDWRPDPEKFPNGLAPIGQLCEENGIQPLLWFMPEFIHPDHWPKDNPEEFFVRLKNSVGDPWMDRIGLLDLGNPACRQWLTERVERIMTESHFKIYRQDFWPGPFPMAWWREMDGKENRMGISENLHIQGYLRFWDDLLMDIPDLWIDSCAGGGRRNDIEAMLFMPPTTDMASTRSSRPSRKPGLNGPPISAPHPSPGTMKTDTMTRTSRLSIPSIPMPGTAPSAPYPHSRQMHMQMRPLSASLRTGTSFSNMPHPIR